MVTVQELQNKIAQLTSYIELHAGDCESLRTEVDMFRERCEEAEADNEALRLTSEVFATENEMRKDKIEELEAKVKRMEDNLITDCEPCPFDEAATTLQEYTNKIEAALATSQTEANDLRQENAGLVAIIEELNNG